MAVRRVVSWSESDPAGMMNSPRAFDYAIDAIEAIYREAVGITFTELITRHGLGAPLVHLSCEYSAPLHEGDRFTVTARIEHLGRSSIVWRVEARRRDRRIAFRAKLVSSFVRRRDFKPVAMPPAFRAGFARYLASPPAAKARSRTRRAATRRIRTQR